MQADVKYSNWSEIKCIPSSRETFQTMTINEWKFFPRVFNDQIASIDASWTRAWFKFPFYLHCLHILSAQAPDYCEQLKKRLSLVGVSSVDFETLLGDQLLLIERVDWNEIFQD